MAFDQLGKEGKNMRVHNGFAQGSGNCSNWVKAGSRRGKWQKMALQRWDVSDLSERDCSLPDKHAENGYIL